MLRRERNIMIVSPYIDDYYARYLMRHCRGKSVRILSSSIRPEAARRLKGRDMGLAVAFALALAALNLVLFSIGREFPALAAISAAAAIALLAFSYRRRNGISLRVPRDFVHAKIYVGDGMAIEGSANLTYAGMHGNVEHVNITFDKEKIGELKRQFARLWDAAR
jgi:phosphatidylserine/phosphatidylglycerophosphate/cardiolipin synthase-like enzyme